MFLSNVNSFGYNPLQLRFRRNFHFSSIQDAEVINALNEIDWDLSSGAGVPSFANKELLHQLKKTTMIASVCPFMASFASANLQPLSPSDCRQIAADVLYLVKQAPSDSHESLLAVKRLLDAVQISFQAYRKIAARTASRACLFLSSIQAFQTSWPPSKLADLILSFVFDDFATELISNQGPVVDPKPFKLVLVCLSQFNICQDPDYFQKMTYRYSLLPISLQTEVSEFFK